ncbi:histidine phosphatase family protein [Azohydromonas lata]|uniref:histidine phosphatase family protein n=1 Tax=Azohydromonas lata TaxID=45677 RepID=UPI000A8DE010|nr:histidine phosphatase family protein [Azohydromonas lata]
MGEAEPAGMQRRQVLAAVVAGAAAAPAWSAAAPDDAAWAALRAGGIVLLRHAEAPGVGDPPGFTLGDCATQRNLSGRGREQARRVGERLRAQRVAVGAVWTSQWCRTRDTAALLALGEPREEPAFNSFFDERGDPRAQTAAARERLLAWRGPRALVVVTHQVNITALTGAGVTSAEGIVLSAAQGRLDVVGRLEAPR